VEVIALFVNRILARRRPADVLLSLLAGLLALGGAAIPVTAAPTTQSAGDPLVLAFYYTWFDENTWTLDRLSDLPAEPYVSRDRGVMGRHIEQAQRSGIDAFLVAWYGPGGGPNQTETNLAAMLEEAAARGFKLGVLFETNGPFFGGTGDITAALQHLLATHANHPAFLRVDGRPVVFFWRPTIYGVDTWRSIRNQADPGNSSIWISEGVDTSYLSVFDGHHLYSNTWNPPADLTATNAKFAGRVASARNSLGAYKFWVATVMPGYDDVRIRGGGGFARNREGGAYYGQSWQAAIAGSPNWIVINSFNEWPEGSFIEPSATYGDLFLNLTAQYSGQFKSGGGQPVQLAGLPTPAPTEPPTPTPEPTVPTAYVTVPLVNLRSGPGTDFAIVSQSGAGAALPITGRAVDAPAWWQVATGSGEAWVFADMVTTGGPLDQVPDLAPVVQVASATATPTPALAAETPVPPAVDPAPAALTAPSAGPLADPEMPSLFPVFSR
jgi:hypothetical protein